MRSLDSIKAYIQARGNGWSHGEARETARLVYGSGGLSPALKAAGMTFSSGGSSWGWGGGGLYWPDTFRKLTDPWPMRAGWDPRGIGREAFERNSTIQSGLSWTKKNFPEARFIIHEGTGDDAKEIEGHPLTQLVANPNPHYSAPRLWGAVLDDWWLNGNAYLQIIRDGGGTPVELWPVPEREIQPDWPKSRSNVYISRYLRSINGESVSVAVRDIIHFRFGQDPMNLRKGWSPLLAGAAEVGVLNEGAAYRGALLANHAVPSYALTPKDQTVAQSMDKEKAESLERLWMSKFTGQNRGRLFIPNFWAELQKVGYSPQELDIRELMEFDQGILCSLMGLSAMVLDLPSGKDHQTYSNKPEAREAAYESNIVPTRGFFEADLTLQLLPQFERRIGNLRVASDYSQVRVLQDDQDKLYRRLDTAVRGGWMTPDEARKKVGLKPLTDAQRAELRPQALPFESRGDASVQGQDGASLNGTGNGQNGKREPVARN